MKKFLVTAAFWLLTAGAAVAGVPCSLPFTLTNGTLADATQVMANYNALVACLTNAAAAGNNTDITSLGGLTTPISPTQGGLPPIPDANFLANTGGVSNALPVATKLPHLTYKLGTFTTDAKSSINTVYHARLAGGGGGGGGTTSASTGSAGGGGPGCYLEGIFSGIGPNVLVTVVAGTLGAGGGPGSNGSPGAGSTISAPGITTISAPGGGGGLGTAGGAAGPGGGGACSPGASFSAVVSLGTANAGGAGSASGPGGFGASTPFGPGGDGARSGIGSSGSPGVGAGSGGGGALFGNNGSGANGQNGLVVIDFLSYQ